MCSKLGLIWLLHNIIGVNWLNNINAEECLKKKEKKNVMASLQQKSTHKQSSIFHSCGLDLIPFCKYLWMIVL